MTNWFNTHHINPLYGWGPTKRCIIQAGPDVPDSPTSHDEMVRSFRGLIDYAREAHCMYVEIRCFEDYSAYRPALEQAGFTYVPHYDVHIDTGRPIPEPKMRQIKAAMAQGQSWRETTAEEDLRTWYKCLRRLYRTKVRRPLPAYRWFREMVYDKGCRLLVVEQGAIIGGVMLAVEEDRSKAYEWYICGQVMSTWAAIEWCRQHGVMCFDTMGAGCPGTTYGVRDFKVQMGGTLHEWGRYIHILHPTIYRLAQHLLT